MEQVVIISVVLLLSACESSTHHPSFSDTGYLISAKNADSIRVVFTWYDRVVLSHQSGVSVKSREFGNVGVGFVGPNGYNEVMSSGSTYDASSDAFSFEFNFALTLDSTKRATPVVVRYYHRGTTFTDVVSVIQQYKYPYTNSEIYLTNSIVGTNEHFQDIDFFGGKLYFLLTGGGRLFEHDAVTNTTRLLTMYGGGDHIAADSGFVFFNKGPDIISRYDLTTGVVQEIVRRFPSHRHGFRGLATYRGFLYAFDESGSCVRKYSYDGTQLDSIANRAVAFHATIGNGVVYTGTFSDSIRRIALTSMNELPFVASPARNLEGIRIHNGRFYYCDYYKGIVASVPVEDLR